MTPEEYRVMREKGTEPPFSGEYVECHDTGVYHCKGCGHPLFSSETKYDSGTGWPSFYAPLENDSIEYREDTSYGMQQIEVVCAHCGSHLGHVYDDGPAPTGKRYCINSICLHLSKD